MSAQVENGNKPSQSLAEKSQFLSHLTSYPLISDTLHTLASHPYAQSPLNLTHTTLNTLTPYTTPFVAPFTPYLTPYLTRLDSLATSALSAFDARVPAAQKPTKELYDQTRELALRPYTLSIEGGEYVKRTWAGEVKRGGEGGGHLGVVGLGRAMVGTGVVVGGEVLKWARGEKGGQVVNEKQ